MTAQEQADSIVAVAALLDDAGTDKEKALLIVSKAMKVMKMKDNNPRLIAEMEAVEVIINALP